MSKETLTSTVWGIAPWSEELLRVSGDVDRGRATNEDFAAQLQTDEASYKKVLRAAKIDWNPTDHGGTYDYLRQTVKDSTGFTAGIDTAPVTRWFDTNTFYRKPTISNKLQYKGGSPAEESEALQPTFLTPVAFAELCDRGQGISKQLALDYVTELYNQIFSTLQEPNGRTPVLLHDPLLAYTGCESGDLRRTVVNLGKLASENPEIELGVYFSGGDAGDAVTYLADSDIPISLVGCDLTKTAAASLPKIRQRTFLAGVIDAKNTIKQNDRDIVEILETVCGQTEPAEISLTHTVDLEHLPRPYAIKKINQIGRIASRNKIGE